MKYYDLPKAKLLIEERKESIESASLGMHEDWFWTAQTIFENGELNRELPDNGMEMENILLEERKKGLSLFDDKYDELSKHHIGGVFGSYWATPTLQLIYKDGTDEMIEVSFGESTCNKPNDLLGPLSGPVQSNITPLKQTP